MMQREKTIVENIKDHLSLPKAGDLGDAIKAASRIEYQGPVNLASACQPSPSVTKVFYDGQNGPVDGISRQVSVLGY